MRKAFALALTLWIVAIMSLVTALYLNYGKITVQKTKLLNKKLDAIFKVESTVELLKFYGVTGEFLSNTIKNKILQRNFPSFPNQIFTDGRETKWNKQIIKIQDISGLIGTADMDALVNYIISNVNISKDKSVIIKESMLDWLDSNEITNLNGAEAPFYSHKGLGYTPRNENYIASLDEIFLLKGLVGVKINRKKLKSKLILSSFVLRNILTMDINVLSALYHFSKIEQEQLIKAKKESNKTFVRLFYELRPKELNSELTGLSSSRIMKVLVSFKDKEIYEEVSFIISFRQNEFTISEIIEYNN